MKGIETEGRKGMKNNKSTVQKLAAPALTLLGLFVAMAPPASAKHRSSKAAEAPATVVAHLALPGTFASGMLLQEDGDARYLYIEQASQDGFAIVNVSNPSEPNLIRRADSANREFRGELRLVGSGLALAEAVEADSAAADPPPNRRAVNVLNLSDPANPRAVLSFSGVTSTLADEARNLVYITDSRGLWIVRNNQALAAIGKQHPCSTSDAFNDTASCQ